MRTLAWMVVLGLCGSARAQEALPLELAWQAPSECPDEGAVRAQLARIAHARAGYALTPLAAQGEVEKRGAGYVLRLRTEHEGEAGERTLEARDCETLVQSATLVLALAFGPGVELATQAPPPESPPASEAPASQAPVPAPVEEKAAAPEPAPPEADEPEPEEIAPSEPGPPLELSVLAGASAQLALLPSPALGLTLGVELALDRYALQLRATGLPGVAEDVAPDARARFDGAGGALLGCAAVIDSAVRTELCAGARIAALRGRTSGALEAGEKIAPFYAALGALAARWPAGALLQLRLEAQLGFALNRPRFEIENLRRVHRVPSFSTELAAFVVLTP